MKVFISHSSQDVAIAKSIIAIIRSSLNLKADDIRCTSVNGYRLPIGVKTEERLKKEIFESEVLVGIITPSSLSSHYVLFELGARWGQNQPIFPIICSESGYELLTGPLQGINSLDGTDEAQLFQFVNDLSKQLKIESESPDVFAAEISELAKKCKSVSQDQKLNVNNISNILMLLEKEKITVQGVDSSMDNIFLAISKTLAYGAFRDDISQPLFSITSKTFSDDYENERILGELILLDLVTKKNVQGTLHPQYTLTDFGKEVLKEMKSKVI